MITIAVAGPAEDAGYEIERERGAVVVALPSVMAEVMTAVRQHGTLYDAAATRPDAQRFTGRGAAYRMRLTDADCVVRHYRRGGAIAHVLHDEYVRAGEPRPLRELHASIAARARGVPTPEVVAAIVYLAGPLYRADLATRFVAGSRDLATVLFGSAADRSIPRPGSRASGQHGARWSGSAAEPARSPGESHEERRTGRSRLERSSESDRIAGWFATGALLRSAFAAGVEHADLNLRNILLTGAVEAPRALLIDLDRATVHAQPVSDVMREAMLARLHRSRVKLENLAGARSGTAELAAFDEGLRGADG